MANLTGPDATVTLNGWFISNNFWDTTALGSGYTLSGTYNPANLTTGLHYSWNFGPLPADGYYWVHAFPEVGFGQDAWTTSTLADEKPFPLSISSLSKYLVNYNASWGGQGAGYNVALEMYLTSKPQGGAGSITNEIMVWIHDGGWHPGGSVLGTFSDSNYSGQIYSYPVYESGLHFNYTALLTNSDDPSGTIDIKAIIQKLKSMGIITGNEYISNVQLGAEIAAGSGSLNVNALQLDVQQSGGSEQLIDGTGTTTVTGGGSGSGGGTGGGGTGGGGTGGGSTGGGSAAQLLLPEDFNGDKKADVIWQNTSGNAMISTMNGATVLSSKQIGNPGSTVHAVTTGDFNGDGKTDILWWDNNGQASIWLMSGTSVLSSGVAGANPGPSWRAVSTGDFNGDGKFDILWQNTSTGQAMIYEMNGLSVIASAAIANNPGPSWHVAATGDFNGDGKSDIVWQNTDGNTTIWMMNGSSVLSTTPIGNPGSNMHAVATGDFNGDGKSDILWWDDSGQASTWLMDGTHVLSYGIAGSNPGSAWRAIGAGDYNGDGKSDILWQNASNGQAMISTMNGLSPITTAALTSVPGTGWHAVT
jgi:hypothetical protein